MIQLDQILYTLPWLQVKFYIQYMKIEKKIVNLVLKTWINNFELNNTTFQLLFILQIFNFNVNKRLLIVAIVLGSLVTVAFFVGSPMFGGFDMGR